MTSETIITVFCSLMMLTMGFLVGLLVKLSSLDKKLSEEIALRGAAEDQLEDYEQNANLNRLLRMIEANPELPDLINNYKPSKNEEK